jgi:hypothetical protein
LGIHFYVSSHFPGISSHLFSGNYFHEYHCEKIISNDESTKYSFVRHAGKSFLHIYFCHNIFGLTFSDQCILSGQFGEKKHARRQNSKRVYRCFACLGDDCCFIGRLWERAWLSDFVLGKLGAIRLFSLPDQPILVDTGI